jgi:serine/threonine-protein kinase
MELPTGHVLNNRFRIIRLLGKGGMGAVYYAHDPVLNRHVAIKQMLPTQAATEHAAEQMRKQFLREAQILASLHHPNLPRVTDYFIDNDLHYLIMDYIEGQSLLDMLLANKKGFPEDQVLEWADQLLSALDYIHAKNVIHRDIKPANIRRTSDGRIFLVDFGLVKPYNLNDPRTMTMFHGIGTPEYAPPEQYDPGVHTDQRSDIYGLGATLYHLLTGQAPLSVTRRTIEPGAFRLPRRVKADISPEAEQVILRAMEIERAKRFASAADMRAALNLARRPYLVDATRTTDLSALAAAVPASPSRPDRRRRALAMIGVPILLLLGILIGVAMQASTPSAQSASTATPMLRPIQTATSTPTLTPTSTATSTTTATSTPTISATGTITLSVTQPLSGTLPATGQPGSTVTPKSPTGSTPAPLATPAPTKTKVTPPGQVKPTNTPKSNPGGGGGNPGNPNPKPTKKPKI